jgi:hypothetical protein
MCEKCEAIRELLLQNVAESAARVAAQGAPADFDGWLGANPQAIEDLQLARIPYELAQIAWMHGFIAGRLLQELGLPPNMPAADA